MAARKALVVKASGAGFEEKPASDYVDGAVSYAAAQGLTAAQQAQARANVAVHAYFTATSTSVPGISLGATSYISLTVTPAISGDSLVTTDRIHIEATNDLPSGVNIASWSVSGTNTVRVGVTSSALLSLTTTTINWRITAHR